LKKGGEADSTGTHGGNFAAAGELAETVEGGEEEADGDGYDDHGGELPAVVGGNRTEGEVVAVEVFAVVGEVGDDEEQTEGEQ